VLLKQNSTRWFILKSMYDQSLACISAISQWQTFLKSFTHKMAAKASWHQNCVTVTLYVYGPQESQTHVESGLIFLVDDESNFAERRRRLRMVAFAELVALVEHAAGDHVGREVQKTRSDRRKGDSLQPARVRLR